MIIKIQTNCESYRNELEEMVRAFSPYLTLGDGGVIVTADLLIEEDKAITIIKSSEYGTISGEYPLASDISELSLKRYLKRYLKRDLYDYFSSMTGVSLSYGSLTGIRPTKLLYELIEEGKGKRELVDFFRVSPLKSDLIAEIVDVQGSVIGTEKDKVDWFVNP